MTVITTEELERRKNVGYIHESWTTPNWPGAKQERDKRARELRKQGYQVKVNTVGFSDLGRGSLYELEAEKV